MPSEDPSNEALMQAYLAGDKQAFSTLFRRLSPGVHAFFRRSFGPAMADDLLQQTFLKAHRARASYDTGRAVKPWLFTIAGHVRIDEWRKRARTPEDGVDQVEAVDESASADETIAWLRRRENVHNAVDQLPEGQRTVVQLHYFEGLTFAEVAAAIGTSEGAAKVRACRAYERLRALLEGSAS